MSVQFDKEQVKQFLIKLLSAECLDALSKGGEVSEQVAQAVEGVLQQLLACGLEVALDKLEVWIGAGQVDKVKEFLGGSDALAEMLLAVAKGEISADEAAERVSRQAVAMGTGYGLGKVYDLLEHWVGADNLAKVLPGGKERFVSTLQPLLNGETSVDELVSQAGQIALKKTTGYGYDVAVEQICKRVPGMSREDAERLLGNKAVVVDNMLAVCKGEMKPEDAVKNIAQDNAKNMVVHYAGQFLEKNLKGKVRKGLLKSLTKAEVITGCVDGAVDSYRTLKQYFDGEIEGDECLARLGEHGMKMAPVLYGAGVGAVAIPIPVVGSIIGSAAFWTFCTFSDGTLSQALHDAKVAKAERERIERTCAANIAAMRRSRQEMEKLMSDVMVQSKEQFESALSGLRNASLLNDTDWFIESANSITEQFGGTAPFNDMDDFLKKMDSDTVWVF